MEIKTVLSIVAGLGSALICSANTSPLEVGAPAPVVKTVDEEGKEITIVDPSAKGFVLVYFYPKADTPGCTAQACSLRDAYTNITDEGITVYGVSTDTPDDQKAFKEKYDLPFTLIADSDGKVVEAFGVPLRGSFAKRQAFLIKDGKIVWRDLSASTAKQADDVLTIVKEKSGA
ncbi:peroxiredoxin [Rubellicoccus peritrichatus]|uniref:thioredoxin-dependent peroxiredoxin n=1 Tax=Rubellicoccus peritrichatus TaxID=3080537 RepID=A0AAQ3L9Z9_9BACT|nr:peroxiredoxin [Puniceicoccus sp. CR14]WOO41576.1 peroxiredoxin [Puniceicoccus sp. CR14]